MPVTYHVIRRTFEAKRTPPGTRRDELNRNPATSAYMTGSPYLLVCYYDSGRIAWTRLFKTKRAAEKARDDDLLAAGKTVPLTPTEQ